MLPPPPPHPPFWSHPINNNQHEFIQPEEASTLVTFSWSNSFEGRFKNSFSLNSCKKIESSFIVAKTYPRRSWFVQTQLTIPEEAFTQETSFICRILFLEAGFFFSIYSYIKIQTPLWPNPISGNYDLNKLEFTLSEDNSTYVTVILAKWF